MNRATGNKKKLVEIFPNLSKEQREKFKHTLILNISLFKKSNKMEITLFSKEMILSSELDELEKNCAEILEINEVIILPQFEVEGSLKEKILEYQNRIFERVYSKVPLARGILAGSSVSFTNDNLIFLLNSKGNESLKMHQVDSLIESMVEEIFAEKVTVLFEDIKDELTEREVYLRKKAEEELKIVKMATSEETRKTHLLSEKETTEFSEFNFWVILGKKFFDKTIDIAEVNDESGKVCIQGEIFDVEFREIRGGRTLCTFDMSDDTNSITVKFFVEKNEEKHIREHLCENNYVRVLGEVQYDKYQRETVVKALDIMGGKPKIKEDNAEQKRVELHAHTHMSAMDAVTSTESLIKRAALFGHKAVAITDHGVVQSFPEAYDYGKKHNVKIIYGVECYLLDDRAPTVYNITDYSLNEAFVAINIETTGLIAERDKITKIDAVKITDGKIIDKFSSFVNPQISIPSFIVKITGISDKMVENAPYIDSVLNDLADFIGGAVIVAHNAPFDMAFIKGKVKKTSKLIDKPIIDTMQLTRNLFPEIKRYGLKTIAKHLDAEVKNDENDYNKAQTTANIFIKCLEILREKGINKIDEIQKEFNAKADFKKAHANHAIILVKNLTGLKNLYKIISESHLKYFYKKPLVPKDLLMRYREGLILGSACAAGELFQAIKNKIDDREIARIVRFYDYLEVQPLGNNEFLINNGEVESVEELININKKIVKFGQKLRKPVVATCDVHFLDKKDEIFRRILMSGQGYLDADNQAPVYFRNTEEMLFEFEYLGEEKALEVVVTNTNLIADSIDEIAPIPEGKFRPKIEGSNEKLEEMAYEHAKSIYGDPLPKVIQDRLKKELDSIIKNNFSIMYIIAQKLVEKSLSDGYKVGARGSVGSSLVANVIGITDVNALAPHYICPKCKYSEFFIEDDKIDCGYDLPDKKCPECDTELKKDGFNIPFETFLGFEGEKEPDIDLNFSREYQSTAHKYTEELFGEGNVYRACTVNTLAEKSAYGYVKNYFEKKNIINSKAETNRLVKGCSGIKKTTGQHPGGIMIVPEDKEIFDFCPIQMTVKGEDTDTVITHFDYHSIKETLLKIDELGHVDPSMIKMLEDLTGIDSTQIPIDDKKTMSIFSGTEGIGVKAKDINCKIGVFAIPEFGTKLSRQMLIETMPKTVSELVKIMGLSHGTNVWLNNTQDILKNNIATLNEAICCRDDIMQHLIKKGLPSKTAFTISEAVRKGKGLSEEFEKTMAEYNVPKWYIESCKKIKYLFPKAHAAAYFMMSFRIAWFKVHYPEAFYAAYFTLRADDFDAELITHGADKIKNLIKEISNKDNGATIKEKSILTILEVINEMYSRGINFLPVDLYKSDAFKFQITEKGILPPFVSLPGLGENAAQRIVEARKKGGFESIDGFRIKTKISKTVVDIIKKHGCFEGMHESNQVSLFEEKK